MAKNPFSQETKDRLLPLLDNDDFVEELVDQLYVLFSQDQGFSHTLFGRQMGVMRGQIMNLKRGLREQMSPFALVQIPTATLEPTEAGMLNRRRYRQTITSRPAWFQNC